MEQKALIGKIIVLDEMGWCNLLVSYKDCR
jgi:hypothetical protein